MPIWAVASSSSGWRGRDKAAPADRSVFMYGFAKSGQANLTDGELAVYKKLAVVFLGASAKELDGLLDSGELNEVACDG